MSEIEVSSGVPNPFVSTPQDNTAHREFTVAQCRECGAMGTWVETERNDKGRITVTQMFDVDHNKETGHTKFWFFELTRSRAEIFAPKKR